MFCRRKLQQCCFDLLKESRVPPRISRDGIPTSAFAPVRCLSTQRDRRLDRPDSGSIFSSNEPAWKHIFGEPAEQQPRRVGPTSTRRQTITDSEKTIIRELLDEVLEARESQSPEGLAKAEAMYEAIETTPKKKSKVIYRKVLENDSALQVALDEMKHVIERCPTKVALLQWAQTHVFTILEAPSPKEDSKKEKGLSGIQQLHLLQHLVPLLMRNFRERFNDPNIALFIFKSIRNHSTQSYVYGCSAPTYNELITLLWESFRDLQGIRDALEEMLVNSVEANGQTELVAERACREAMNGRLWLDHTEEGDQVAMSTLSGISELLVDLMAAKESKAGKWGRLKRDIMKQGGEDDLDDLDD